ncbi:MAG TPA: lamin tail domain-containing protein [Anaerolineaceae bacterium]|nr:lamin tail domain-containing protein [Anaerolineaceae bacterium]
MRSFKRMLPFIILNVIISAATTLAVLYWWDKTQRPVLPDPRLLGSATSQVITTNSSSQNRLATSQVTQTALSQNVIQIQNVFGVGDINNEVVQLKRVGSGDLWLTGWQLKDQNGHTYTFPKLLLNKDGAVQVYTQAGADSVIELHWGLPNAVWHSGELVSLLDPQGILRASYQIP